MKGKGNTTAWIIRIGAMALAILAFVTLLLPCVSLTSIGRVQIREAAEEMGIRVSGTKLDASELVEQMEREFSYMGINASPFVSLVNQAARIMQNGSASATELKGILGDGLSAFQRIQQQFMGGLDLGYGMDEETSHILDQAETANRWLTIGWWATLAVAALTVLALALRFRFAGILQIATMAAWPIAIALLLRRYEDTLNGVVTVGYGPYLGVLFAAASFALALAAGAVRAGKSSRVRFQPAQGGGASGGAMPANHGWTCPACGNRVEAHNAFCSACGTPRPSKRLCPACGAECPDGMNFCTKCGSPVPQQGAPVQPFAQPQPNAYAPRHSSAKAQPSAYTPRHLSADAPQSAAPYNSQANAYGDIDQTVRAQGPGGTVRLFSEAAAAPFSMTITELVNGAPAQGYSVSLVGAMTIGRSPACDLQLTEGTVSGSHLKLERVGDALIATDLNSSNGTALKGQRIAEPTAIHSGDTLQLGNAVLRISF